MYNHQDKVHLLTIYLFRIARTFHINDGMKHANVKSWLRTMSYPLYPSLNQDVKSLQTNVEQDPPYQIELIKGKRKKNSSDL